MFQGSRLQFSTAMTTAVTLALLALQVFAQTVEGPPSLILQIIKPTVEQHFRLDNPSIKLSFQIEARAGLKEVVVEVIGEHTGTFFTVCGGEEQPCEEKQTTHLFDISCPVFEGKNILKIQAVDHENNSGNASTRIQVNLIHVETSATTPGRKHYKLLILTHKNPSGDDFEAVLQPLIQHKNNTGMPTVLMTLEELYETPALRGRDHPEIIKKGIAKAKLRWGIKYVMLVGDSDRFPVRYTRIHDLGHWGHGFAPSDLYYADLFRSNGSFDSWDYDDDDLFGEMQGNFPQNAQDLNQDRVDLIPDVAIGRVPASNKAELERYVSKIINYETNAAAPWFKNALLVTGDYPGSNGTNDFIGTQLASKSFTLNKQYHDQVWPTTTTENQRWAIIENALDQGVGFLSYVGHGSGTGTAKDGGLWGGWYRHYRIPHLNNQDRLPIIFSAACDTGMFHYGHGPYFAKWGFLYDTPINPPKYRWAPEPTSFSPEAYDKDTLAEHFLVKNTGGGIAFIGSYTGTQGGSHTLAKNFFKAYASGIDVLGDVWNQAISQFVTGVINNLSYPGHSWRTAATYHHIQKMLLFGDPSLRIGGLQPDLMVKKGPANYCRIQDGKLVIRVANQGPGAAGTSTTQVDFFRYGKFSLATQALAPQQYQDLLVAIPPGCFDSDCNFRIIVDQAAQVTESNEANNSADGLCAG